MRHICAIGLQWGDEGKGKIVDVLTENIDAVIRFQGGANAGHTIYIDEERHVLHHLPSGVLRPGIKAVLGNGMVLEPQRLVEELDKLPAGAVDQVYLSDRAHLVLPHHRAADSQREDDASRPIGTTRRGIGPAYEDKFARRGVRLGDLGDASFRSQGLAQLLEQRGGDAASIEASVEVCARLWELVGERVVDTAELLHREHEEGKRFLFEGAQGCLLDVDFGTYPYVTSSSPSFLGVGPGSGFSPRKIDHVLGITKVYCTRVGEGPFPSEASGEAADNLRDRGGEFGTTTGRPRRCGWIDLPALRYAITVNDVDSLALTKTDVLTGMSEIPVVVAYRIDGQVVDTMPFALDQWEKIEPVYESWPGWTSTDEGAMKPFVNRLEAALNRPVSLLSTGRRRVDICRRFPFEAKSSSASTPERA